MRQRKSPDPKAQARREAILDAAERVFASKGPASATMDDVAEAADVSKGTVYLYFKSKDDLFLSLTHRPLDHVLEAFGELSARPGLTGAELLAQLMDTHGGVLLQHAVTMRVGIASMCADFEPAPNTPSLRDFQERVHGLRSTYIAALERGVADGSLRSDIDPAPTAAAIWAAMFGATFIGMNADRFARRGGLEPTALTTIRPTLCALLTKGLEAESGDRA